MGTLIAFVAFGWWILRKVDDSERSWPAADLPTLVRGATDR
jgi:hypothetical protein